MEYRVSEQTSYLLRFHYTVLIKCLCVALAAWAHVAACVCACVCLCVLSPRHGMVSGYNGAARAS